MREKAKKLQSQSGFQISAIPEDVYTPVRVGPQSDYGNNRWEVYSPKLKRNVTLYSNLEYDHWVLVEFDPEIICFSEQPLKISIKLPDGVVTTIFDMWIRWKSGQEEFREIKFESDLQNDNPQSRVKRQTQAQKKWCELNNKNYSIVTEKTIRLNPLYLTNLKLILRYVNNNSCEKRNSIYERIFRMISEKKACPIKLIENSLPDEETLLVRSCVFEMLYQGRLKCDLENEHLDLNSILEKRDV